MLSVRFHSLADIDDFLADHSVPLFTIIDCSWLAVEIFNRAGQTPLIRNEIEAARADD
jgi:hypothetical protein